MSRQEWRPLYSSIYSTCNNLQKLEWQLLKETPFTVQTCFSKKMTATFHKDIKSWLKNILHQLKFEHLYKIKHFKYHIFFHKETGQQTGQIHILTERKKKKSQGLSVWAMGEQGLRLYSDRHNRKAAPRLHWCLWRRPRSGEAFHRWGEASSGSFQFYSGWSAYQADSFPLWHQHCDTQTWLSQHKTGVHTKITAIKLLFLILGDVFRIIKCQLE